MVQAGGPGRAQFEQFRGFAGGVSPGAGEILGELSGSASGCALDDHFLSFHSAATSALSPSMMRRNKSAGTAMLSACGFATKAARTKSTNFSQSSASGPGSFP